MKIFLKHHNLPLRLMSGQNSVKCLLLGVVKKVVVKVGILFLVDKVQGVSCECVKKFVVDLVKFVDCYEFMLVILGVVGLGMYVFVMLCKFVDLLMKQVIVVFGQIYFMGLYYCLFYCYGIQVVQVFMIYDIIGNCSQYLYVVS